MPFIKRYARNSGSGRVGVHQNHEQRWHASQRGRQDQPIAAVTGQSDYRLVEARGTAHQLSRQQVNQAAAAYSKRGVQDSVCVLHQPIRSVGGAPCVWFI